MRIGSLLIYFVVAGVFALPLEAAVLSPIVAGNVARTDLINTTYYLSTPPIDGPFVSRGFAEQVAVFEYDISAFAGQTITTARLAGTMFPNIVLGNDQREMQIVLSAGDGAITNADWGPGGLLGGASLSYTPSQSHFTFNHTITSALRSVLNNGATKVSIRFRPITNDAGKYQQASTIFPTAALPVLVIDEATPALPTPVKPPRPAPLTPPDVAGPTGFSFTSQGGDSIGRGNTRTYSPANANINIFSVFNDGIRFTCYETGGQMEDYEVILRAVGGKLTVDSYEDTRSSSNQGRPTLDFTGNGVGASDPWGRFDIYDIAYNPDGSVARLAADFEQHADGVTAGAYGRIRFNSTVPEPAGVGMAALGALFARSWRRRRR